MSKVWNVLCYLTEVIYGTGRVGKAHTSNTKYTHACVCVHTLAHAHIRLINIQNDRSILFKSMRGNILIDLGSLSCSGAPRGDHWGMSGGDSHISPLTPHVYFTERVSLQVPGITLTEQQIEPLLWDLHATAYPLGFTSLPQTFIYYLYMVRALSWRLRGTKMKTLTLCLQRTSSPEGSRRCRKGSDTGRTHSENRDQQVSSWLTPCYTSQNYFWYQVLPSTLFSDESPGIHSHYVCNGSALSSSHQDPHTSLRPSFNPRGTARIFLKSPLLLESIQQPPLTFCMKS